MHRPLRLLAPAGAQTYIDGVRQGRTSAGCGGSDRRAGRDACEPVLHESSGGLGQVGRELFAQNRQLRPPADGHVSPCLSSADMTARTTFGVVQAGRAGPAAVWLAAWYQIGVSAAQSIAVTTCISRRPSSRSSWRKTVRPAKGCDASDRSGPVAQPPGEAARVHARSRREPRATKMRLQSRSPRSLLKPGSPD